MQVPAAVIGLLVGCLVSLTGIGGGVLLLPALILVLHVPPIVAVGTSALFMFLTKIGASAIHGRRGNIDVRLALALAVGSTPGAVAGVVLLWKLRTLFGPGVNDILRILIGVLLLVTPALVFLQDQGRIRFAASFRQRLPRWVNRYTGAVATGLVGGFLVGLTSIGSGSIIILLLVMFYRLQPNTLVGTDIFHAVMLTGVTSLAHLKLGTVNGTLVGNLLLGSVPGVLLGAMLSNRIPTLWMRRILLLVLACVGIELLL